MTSIEEKFMGLNFSHMKGCTILDSQRNKIGKLQDAIFRKEGTSISLTKFLIGGSVFEEILEDLKIKTDVDPVFPITVIDGVSPKSIRINVKAEELKSTSLDQDAIGKDEVKLSDLQKYKLYDKNEEKIGNIIDVTFRSKSFTFVVGEGFLKEALEDLGILDDIDLVLEPNFISELGNDYIKISKSKLELQATFDELIPKFKRSDLNEIRDKRGGQDPRPIMFYQKSTI